MNTQDLRTEIHSLERKLYTLQCQLREQSQKPLFSQGDIVQYDTDDNRLIPAEIVGSQAEPTHWAYVIKFHKIFWTEGQPRWRTQTVREERLLRGDHLNQGSLIPKAHRKRAQGAKRDRSKTKDRPKVGKRQLFKPKISETELNNLLETI